MTTIHATEYGRHQGWVKDHPQSYIHGVERWITNRSQRVIACSAYMQEQIADIFAVAPGRITVIPNGIDPADLPQPGAAELARLRAEFAAPEERLVLLIGRLVYEKGFQLALEAMPAVIEAVPGTRFLVAGSGTHEEELKKQAKELGLMEHGTFLGWIGDDVLRSLYAIADLTVVPSIYEPFGLVALEAMASGCPVHRRRHRRPARGRPARGRRPALPPPATRRRSPRSRSASSPTPTSRPAWSPKPTSTSAASTGPTSPPRPPTVYADLVGASSARLVRPRPRRGAEAEGAALALAGGPVDAVEAGRGRDRHRAGELDQRVDPGDPLTFLEHADLGPVRARRARASSSCERPAS